MASASQPVLTATSGTARLGPAMPFPLPSFVGIQRRHMASSPTKKARKALQKKLQAMYEGARIQPFTAALVGRPNVGKSSVFNRLLGRQAAIVNDEPGTTRDYKEMQVAFGGLQFSLVDTGGLEESKDPDRCAVLQRCHQCQRAFPSEPTLPPLVTTSDLLLLPILPSLSFSLPLLSFLVFPFSPSSFLLPPPSSCLFFGCYMASYSLERQMLAHTASVVQSVEVVLFLIDYKQGVTSEDLHFAK